MRLLLKSSVSSGDLSQMIKLGAQSRWLLPVTLSTKFQEYHLELYLVSSVLCPAQHLCLSCT